MRYRLRFEKSGELRLVSHHDLMHCSERLLRRARLPVAATQGFHPQPKMTFAQSLALGVRGLQEVLELELTESIAPDEILERMRRTAPPGLTFHSCRKIETTVPARVRRAMYGVALPAEITDAAERCVALMARETCWIWRTRPAKKQINLRPYIHEVNVTAAGLEMALWVTPTGAARPDEIVRLLGLEHLLAEGAILERTFLEIVDELPEDQRAFPIMASPSPPEPEPESNDAPAGEEPRESARHTSLISNPLSFDS